MASDTTAGQKADDGADASAPVAEDDRLNQSGTSAEEAIAETFDSNDADK